MIAPHLQADLKDWKSLTFEPQNPTPVSYTHLDVYKRQVVRRLPPAGKAEPKRRERVQLSHLATVTAGGQALHILTIGEMCIRDRC